MYIYETYVTRCVIHTSVAEAMRVFLAAAFGQATCTAAAAAAAAAALSATPVYGAQDIFQGFSRAARKSRTPGGRSWRCCRI